MYYLIAEEYKWFTEDRTSLMEKRIIEAVSEEEAINKYRELFEQKPELDSIRVLVKFPEKYKGIMKDAVGANELETYSLFGRIMELELLS